MITRLYILFLGLLFALFVGVGIAAFYQAPKPPDYPIEKTVPAQDLKTPATTDPEIQKRELEYVQKQKAYDTAYKTYNRNVSLMALAGAILFVVLGLTLLKSMHIMNDSLLLGGVFTLIYSIIRGFGAGDDAFRFLLVSASLAIAIALGYIKLIRPMGSNKQPK